MKRRRCVNQRQTTCARIRLAPETLRGSCWTCPGGAETTQRTFSDNINHIPLTAGYPPSGPGSAPRSPGRSTTCRDVPRSWPTVPRKHGGACRQHDGRFLQRYDRLRKPSDASKTLRGGIEAPSRGPFLLSVVLRQHSGKFRHVPDSVVNIAESSLGDREGSAGPAETSVVLFEPSLRLPIRDPLPAERETDSLGTSPKGIQAVSMSDEPSVDRGDSVRRERSDWRREWDSNPRAA